MKDYKCGMKVRWHIIEDYPDPIDKYIKGEIVEVADDYALMVTLDNNSPQYDGMNIRIEDDWNENDIEIITDNM